MQLSWTVTKRSLIHSLSGRMILRISLVEFQVEEHVASLCSSTWLPSYTHTAHVLPSEWRSSTHTPQDSERNIYLVCVCVREINPRRVLFVWVISDFFCDTDKMEGLYLACCQPLLFVYFCYFSSTSCHYWWNHLRLFQITDLVERLLVCGSGGASRRCTPPWLGHIPPSLQVAPHQVSQKTW